MWTCPKCTQKVDDEYEICWRCGTSVDGIENPSFLEEGNWDKSSPFASDEATPESLVMLIKCSKPAEAHAIRVRLESEGIPVFLFDEFTITMDWLLSNAIGGVKVQVPEVHLQRARDILGIKEEKEIAGHEESSEDEWNEPAESTEESDQGIMDMERRPPANQDDRITDQPKDEPK